MGDSQLQNENAEVLKLFFAKLKSLFSQKGIIRFIMVTGVTRSPLLGISSGLNILLDLTLDDEYANICGFTYEELDQYFSDRYEETLKKLPPEHKSEGMTVKQLRDEILFWYDGYSFDGRTHVLNPISIIRFFRHSKFSSYWVDSGPSDALIQSIIEEDPDYFLDIKNKNLSDTKQRLLSTTKKTSDQMIVPFLYQTGYLTIDRVIAQDRYSLRIPNNEISHAMLWAYGEYIVNKIKKEDTSRYINTIKQAIQENNPKAIEEMFVVFLSGFTPEHHVKVELNEAYFHMMIQSLFIGFAFEVLSEPTTAHGYPDLVVKLTKEICLVIEIKFADDQKRAKNPMIQINKKSYSALYLRDYPTLVQLGITLKNRNECKVQMEIVKISKPL
jgi:hypothetical protein